jgi:archaellum component FlaC
MKDLPFIFYRKQTAELRSSFNQMVSDYKDLLSNYENYKKKMQVN